MVSVLAPVARAQDVVGIEICTAEKTMERRTSCLQSNVNFLQQSLTKQALAAQQKLDAANAQIQALKDSVVALQKEVERLKLAAQPAGEGKSDKAKDQAKDQAKEPASPPAKK